jgi:hypothetical protein
MEEPTILICECSSVEHQIVFQPFKEDNGETIIYASIYLWDYSFWKRLIMGIKYIFGYKCKYGQWEEFILTKNHIPSLEKMIKLLKRNKDAI